MRLSLICVLPVHGCFFTGIHTFMHLQGLGLLNCLGNSVSSVSPLKFFPQSSGDICSICQYSDFSFKCFIKAHLLGEGTGRAPRRSVYALSSASACSLMLASSFHILFALIPSFVEWKSYYFPLQEKDTLQLYHHRPLDQCEEDRHAPSTFCIAVPAVVLTGYS